MNKPKYWKNKTNKFNCLYLWKYSKFKLKIEVKF